MHLHEIRFQKPNQRSKIYKNFRGMIKMIKRKNKDGIKGLSEEELEEKINELRMKLNKAIESNIDKDELVNISQELDQYIVLKQKKL